MGVRAAQVQAVWLKEANAGPTQGFPTAAQILRDDLRAVLQNLHSKVPNLKLCYLSSRTCAGYASTGLNPEPYAYESAFSVRWLIEEQLSGSPALNPESSVDLVALLHPRPNTLGAHHPPGSGNVDPKSAQSWPHTRGFLPQSSPQESAMRTGLVLMIHAFLGLMQAASVSAQAPIYVLQWGAQGSASGSFNAPYCVDIDGMGSVYVTDQGNHRVQKFSPEGTFIAAFGSFGSGAGQFNTPSGVAVDAAGFVYVTDRGNHRVQKFSSTGAYVMSWGGNGQAAGQFGLPLGIDVASDGTIVVADFLNDRIQRFTSAGGFLNQWGNISPRWLNVNDPEGIACDAAGFVYVTDHGVGNLVQKFDLAGNPILSWGGTGSGAGQFDGPVGLDADASGRVLVSDSRNQRIQIFTSNGSWIGEFGSPGIGSSEFNKPCDVAGGPSGEIFVVDLLNHRIQKFAEPTVSATSTTWGRIKSQYR